MYMQEGMKENRKGHDLEYQLNISWQSNISNNRVLRILRKLEIEIHETIAYNMETANDLGDWGVHINREVVTVLIGIKTQKVMLQSLE